MCLRDILHKKIRKWTESHVQKYLIPNDNILADWLVFSIKLDYTSDKERSPTSILMTCFTCVWVMSVCERRRNGWSEEEKKKKKPLRGKREIVWLAVPVPGFVQNLDYRHCIVLLLKKVEEILDDSWIVTSESGGNNKW